MEMRNGKTAQLKMTPEMAKRQQEILEAIVVLSLPYRSKEQQEKDLLRQELEDALREMRLEAAQDRRMAR